MENNNTEEIDIRELLLKALDNWRAFVKWALIALVVGIVVAFSIPKEYSVKVMLAPEAISSSSSLSGSLSSLAAMAGVSNLKSGTSRDALSPLMYPDIVKSTPFLVSLFDVPVEVKVKGEMVQTTMFEYVKEYTKSPWWSKAISLPFKALGWFMGLFRKQDEETGTAEINPVQLTKPQAAVAKALSEMITMTVDQKEGTVSCEATAQNPKVAYALADKVLESLQNFVTDYRTEKSRKSLEYMEELFADAQRDYYAAQKAYARYVDANQGVVLQRVMVERQRLQNEMNLQYELYNSCAQQVQLAKAKLAEDTPVYAVIQPPVVPNRASKPSKMTILAAFVFLGLAIEALWLFWGKEFLQSLKKKDDEGADTD